MNQRELNKEKRDFVINYILSKNPEYMLTVNFNRRYSDRESIEAFKFAMRAIQRNIPSDRLDRGTVSIERTWKSVKFDGCLHMHALLWGVNSEFTNPEKKLRELCSKAVLRLTDSRQRRMSIPDNVELTPVYDSEGIAKYVTKDLNRSNQLRSRVWLITPIGLDTSTDYFT